ncbi:MAG: MBOAT family protein [Chlorobi bacterium]|nr:MBOAT family protein [Chlorobiota bacterium]
MVFSSILFLYVFLPVFIIVYHLVGVRLKNYVILVASIFFYAWGAPKFIFLVILSLSVNFYVVRQLYQKQQNRKLFLLISVLINLGLLGYFKYANFFIDNVNFALASLSLNTIHWVKVALPIGISFFTFQSLTYTIDVYRKVHKPLDKLTDYLLYILMFPQLIAGPIVRFNTIADDISDRKRNETIDNKLLGVYRFVIGLSKKILIANVLGEQVDAIYSMPLENIDTGFAWLAVVAYSFQIYFDFSGYSDMAIGLGKIIGFKFPENFDNPYVSGSITEFWHRWHITLGQFMKYYLYIPLGGNRVATQRRLYFNLIVVFILSGFWHGASWNFVIWGAWHGLFLVLDRIFLKKILDSSATIVRTIFTYIVVLVGWVFFRIENITDAFFYLKKMFSFDFSNTLSVFDNEFYVTLILGFIFSFITLTNFGRKLESRVYTSNLKVPGHSIYLVLSLLLLLLCSAYITTTGFNPFIYFRF